MMKPVTPFQILLICASLCFTARLAAAVDVHVPAEVQAGQAFSIHLEGSGSATLYLVGPDHVVKRSVNLGSDPEVGSADLRTAGRYRLIVCDASCSSATFEVKAAEPSQLSFFLHPSRVPVSARDSIDAFAFVFDRYSNLVLTPSTVNFQIKPATGILSSRQSPTHHGVAWMRMDSTSHEGPVRVTAVLGRVEEARVIQQVAAEPCALHIKAAESGRNVVLETDPVRDCSGNALPDGTVVSFTKTDKAGRSTVDTPIKKGIAKTEFPLDGPAKISVACGVVLGNEIAVDGRL
ncbi:MAG: hypothetical protein ACRD3B_07250 [Candidatus Sulfotelmatobacter sp.]